MDKNNGHLCLSENALWKSIIYDVLLVSQIFEIYLLQNFKVHKHIYAITHLKGNDRRVVQYTLIKKNRDE